MADNPNIEEIERSKKNDYEYPGSLKYIHDKSLKGKSVPVRFDFDEGALRCSERAKYEPECSVAPNEQNTIALKEFSFVYLDAGGWFKDSYNFGLVCGPDVYLCEHVPNGSVARVKKPAVRELFEDLARFKCGVRVKGYYRASNNHLNSYTLRDDHLYIFIPDHHLPPISWTYHDGIEISALSPSAWVNPPEWLQRCEAFKSREWWYRGLYSKKHLNERAGEYRRHHADIFGLEAGMELAQFLRALGHARDATRSRLHVINMGDMCELWLDRDYQYRLDENNRAVLIPGGAEEVQKRVMEVILNNIEVFQAYRDLGSAGLAEVKFLWGNHDAYLKENDRVTELCGLPPRDSSYTGLFGDLHAEHGHRFDSANFDDVKYTWHSIITGPDLANKAYTFPPIRKAEPWASRTFTKVKRSFFGENAQYARDAVVLGASLIYYYLYHCFGPADKPFSIFVMGHTHEPLLRHISIRLTDEDAEKAAAAEKRWQELVERDKSLHLGSKF